VLTYLFPADADAIQAQAREAGRIWPAPMPRRSRHSLSSPAFPSPTRRAGLWRCLTACPAPTATSCVTGGVPPPSSPAV